MYKQKELEVGQLRINLEKLQVGITDSPTSPLPKKNPTGAGQMAKTMRLKGAACQKKLRYMCITVLFFGGGWGGGVNFSIIKGTIFR